ncbi:M16 family metallopeptidase [Aeromonas cavernicola]|uniref:Peptidase M16 n=1 Tax=Aeromonas cavernicola TaxID=1006623 RepID=A0A2H9U678_9GAMM|nr:pitrilysin family protein [Aeromonas cavernicola]PJG59563.1 peptidase M16 [Aeromonas cavernicola]
MNKLIPLSMLLGFTLPVLAAPTLVAEQLKEEGKLAIPYQLYKLDNGLTVILAPDRTDPLVHLDVTYHVGSSRETVGKSGFAHFFEHMMFQGSKHVGDQEHMRIINEAGGDMNGTTNKDRTNYYETVPANQLEKVLWLEADRMGFLLDAVSQKKFEIQRSTVKNERAQRVDNQPYGLVSEKVGEALYPRTHPYSWQPIGYVEDLDRVDVNDLKQFFLRWYGPNNATLTLGGDFDTKQALAWIEQYFGSIPRGPEVAEPTPKPVTLPETRYLTLEDKVHLPLLYISYPTVSLGDPQEPALDMFADVLGGSASSMLYQSLVKTGKAIDVGASHYCEELACTLTVYAYPNPAVDGSLKTLKGEVDKVIGEFAQRGLKPEDLEKAISSYRASAIWGLDSVSGKVSQLAMGQVFAKDPNYVFKTLDAISKVTPAQVKSAYDTFIANKSAVVMSVVPKGKGAWQVAKPNFVPAKRALPDYSKHDVALVERPVKDTFDRSVQPNMGGAVSVNMPVIWHGKLDQGIQIIGTQNDEIPAVSIIIALPGGMLAEGKGELGLANLTAAMMGQGSERLTEADLSDELRKLGSSVSVSSAQYNTLITISSLADKLPQTLALVQEVYQQPGLRAADFERVKAQLLQGMQQSQQQPEWLVSQAFRELVYGKQNRLGQPSDGTATDVAKLTLADVRRFYQRYYSPHNAKVVVVGDVTQSQLEAQLGFLTQWQGKAPTLGSLMPKGEQAKPGIYLVDKPGAPQSVIRIGRRAMPFDTMGDYFTAGLMNFNLGGNFNSRINLNLREDKGYTYGASSGFSANREAGTFATGADVRSDATVDAIRQFLQELDNYRTTGPTPVELAYMRSAVSQQDAISYETLDQKASFLLQMIMYDLQPDYVQAQTQRIKTVASAELKASAAHWLDPAQMVIVVVGDKQKLEKPLQELHLPIYPLQLP